jgi:hypothetical protein
LNCTLIFGIAVDIIVWFSMTRNPTRVMPKRTVYSFKPCDILHLLLLMLSRIFHVRGVVFVKARVRGYCFCFGCSG